MTLLSLPLAWAGWDAEKIFWQLAIEDIRAACDLFQPLYEETNGGDGYVSIEVSPDLAHDTEATVAQAEQLWARVRRPNLMVKIPATKEGIPAIRKAIAVGINVNVTLIFSLKRYAEVMEAYLSGLEDHVPRRDIPSITLPRLPRSLSRASIPRSIPGFPKGRLCGQGCHCECETCL